MHVFRGPGRCSSAASGCVATIGVFDGVHLGHQRILEQGARGGGPLRPAVARLQLRADAPGSDRSPLQAPARLMRLREKVCVLKRTQGFEHLFSHLSSGHPGTRARGVHRAGWCRRTLGVRHLSSATISASRGAGQAASTTSPQADGSTASAPSRSAASTSGSLRVSSTAIRNAPGCRGHGRRQPLRPALPDGGQGEPGPELRRAARLSDGRHSAAPSRQPGERHLAVRVPHVTAHALDAVASIGTRPTVAGVAPAQGPRFRLRRRPLRPAIAVDFVARLRDEVRFDDLEAPRGRSNWMPPRREVRWQEAEPQRRSRQRTREVTDHKNTVNLPRTGFR